MKNIKKSDYSYHRWIWFAYSYLTLVKIGLEKMQIEIDDPSNINNIENYFAFRKKYLFIPIIYNLKHSLEIILKGLHIQANNDYIQTHDIMINKKALKLIVSRSSDKNTLNDLDKIVDKYYKIEFFNGNLNKKIKISDKSNDMFRFPENSASCFLDSECFGTFNKVEINSFIKELKEDANSLSKLLMTLKNDVGSSKM
ncbi:MAG: hypothetical protein WCT02_03070 [Candidatus Paceibacterota bacterium]